MDIPDHMPFVFMHVTVIWWSVSLISLFLFPVCSKQRINTLSLDKPFDSIYKSTLTIHQTYFHNACRWHSLNDLNWCCFIETTLGIDSCVWYMNVVVSLLTKNDWPHVLVLYASMQIHLHTRIMNDMPRARFLDSYHDFSMYIGYLDQRLYMQIKL